MLKKREPAGLQNFEGKTTVRIPFDHLHPALKELIGTKLNLLDSDYPGRRDAIRRARTLRTVVDVQGILALNAILTGYPTPDILAVTGLIGVARTGMAKIIQQKHRDLKDAIKENGFSIRSLEAIIPASGSICPSLP